MQASFNTPPELIQGTEEWKELRRNKITATDASVIMGMSPWKNRLRLYEEKVLGIESAYPNAAMQRGVELEPIARGLFSLKVGVDVYPKVIIKDWAMASLDGISDCGEVMVEIKCPGSTDHSLALRGKVPDHYYPQLQHQLYVSDLDSMYYFSFDGFDGVIVEIERNDSYIKSMVEKELAFYESILNKIPPNMHEDYIEREDDLWKQYATEWKKVTLQLKSLEKREEGLRKKLVHLSGGSNSRGEGISLYQSQRKGTVDYSKIPELQNIDLDLYRNDTINTWRIRED